MTVGVIVKCVTMTKKIRGIVLTRHPDKPALPFIVSKIAPCMIPAKRPPAFWEAVRRHALLPSSEGLYQEPRT